jgi:hypothetical protein
MPIQLPQIQNVSTSLAACIFSTQAIRISLWTVQAISILAIFYAAEPHSFIAYKMAIFRNALNMGAHHTTAFIERCRLFILAFPAQPICRTVEC